MTNQNLDQKIKDLKEKIHECRDYISSDFCKNCVDMYKKIEAYEKQIKDLENERT
jgi:uncharacterized protein Yka (UPF0111/DUF47 family)